MESIEQLGLRWRLLYRTLIVIVASLYRRIWTVRMFQAANLLFTSSGQKNSRNNPYHRGGPPTEYRLDHSALVLVEKPQVGGPATTSR